MFGNAPRQYRFLVDRFKGVDFANSEVTVDKSRGVDCVNIMADLAGKPIKRAGWEILHNLEGAINGIHRLKTAEFDQLYVHAGTKLYAWSGDEVSEVYSGMNDARSVSVQHNGQLVLLDGLKMLVVEDGVVDTAENKAYIPTVVIGGIAGQAGAGGGDWEGVNLLTPKRYVNFAYSTDGTGDIKFHVPEGKIANDSWLVVEKSYGDDEWESVAYTANRADGYVTISSSLLNDLPDDVDNVRIGYEVAPKDGGADIINHCTVAKMFGVGGNTDRLFVSGNPSEPNKVYYSDLNEVLQMADINYLTVGADSSEVKGFSRVQDYLGVHKEENEQDSSIFLIQGVLDSQSKAMFSVKAGVNGVGAISKYGFAEFAGEPIFVSRNGVYGITTQEITFERYAENRSYYINPRLLNEDLSNAVGIEHNNYYYLAINGKCYVADGRQKVYERNAPMSGYQYEWYYFDNIPARVWYSLNGDLYFGTEDGKLCRFYRQEEHSPSHNIYVDGDGRVVKAKWVTPYFYFDQMNYYKNLRHFAVMLAPYGRSGIEVYYRSKGQTRMVKDENADIFDFNDIDFTRFTFNVDDAPLIVAANEREKRFMLIQFKFENNKAEPFGLYGFAGIYTVSSKYKG